MKIGVGRIAAGAVVLVVSFVGALWALDTLSSRGGGGRPPALAAMPPLAPATRTSTITAPIAVPLSAIRDAMEQQAPRELAGKRDNPLTQLLGKADIGWTLARGPIAVTGRGDGLVIATPVNGTLRITGQIANQAGNVGGALGGLINSDLGRGLQTITGRTLDQRADLRGNVTVTARPIIDNHWRIEPNLGAQVAMGDSALSIAGIKLSVANEVKPLLERSVNEGVTALAARIRNDPALELAARREWAKMCRAISLKGVGANAPDLWLEVRPTKAFAAQPRIDQNSVTLTLGLQAETRIVPAETRPDCPFPAQLQIVRELDQGAVAIGVPIDVPFTEVNRLIDAQLKGRNFPEDGGGAFAITVLGATLAPSGDRLLVALRVTAREQKTLFGFGAEATVYVWGRPVLDPDRQILRLTDLTVDVQSEAAFGLLGAAAEAAMPYLQAAVADNAVIDLKPFAASAQQSIGAALAEVRAAEPGMRVDAAITGLRLVGIEYDAKILRIVAEAQGTVQAAVTSLPAR
ncbi:MAG TPA: DUF4403 family protein [Xanthobacteraceae bacterium]|nr:DUF4403 family protein [Xanthobacteraceae bacterium]